MSGMLLSCYNWPIIKQIGDLLGIIMNLIYIVFDKIGIANIGLCIIVFTIIVRLCMIPMSIKQQKTMKLSSLMNPEIQAIQKKYRGKNDNASMMAMNAETKAVYEKYGTSPSGGCLPLLIQMPILIALYGVISAIPTHVGAVGDMYDKATDYIYESMDEYSELSAINQLMVENKVEGFKEQKEFDKIVDAYYDDSKKNLEDNKETIKKILSDSYTRQAAGLDLNNDSWDDIKILKDTSAEIIESLKKVSDESWTKVSESDLSPYESNIVKEYSEAEITDYDNIISTANTNYNKMEDIHKEVIDVYSFVGIDLSRSPAQEMSVGIWWAILIPILSAITQWISMSMSTKQNQSNMADNPMASSMKVMNITMPIMSAFFCYSFASGLGLYWVMGSVIQFVQNIIMNAHFKKLSTDDIIKANIEKINKKRAKQGLPPQKITAAANTNVRNIKVNNTNANSEKTLNNSAGVTYKKGGIAAKANMVKEYNEKKNK